MTDLEHYLENALYYMEEGGTYQEFFNQEILKIGEKQTDISLPKMWEIVQYFLYSYRYHIISETEKKLEEAYGYKLDDR